MKLKIEIKPETAIQIKSDLENKNIELLPKTEKFLKDILEKIDEECFHLENEISKFEEIKAINKASNEAIKIN